MKKLLATTILSSMLAMPAFAMDDTSCADFTAMDSDAQMEAMSTMHDSMMSDDSMASDDDSMASDDDSMASDDDSMASDDSMEGDAMSGDSMTAEDLATACADNPDMMVSEAMKSDKM